MASIIPILGPLLSAVGSFAGGGSESVQAPAPAEEKTAEPEGALDAEAVRLRALKRRQARQQPNLLSLEDSGKSSVKTLLGE